MTKKELIEILNDFNDDDEIMAFWSHDNNATFEGIMYASRNGNVVQLNCESLLENDTWNDANKNPEAN